MLVTPLGFCFQRIPPPGSRHASRRAFPSCCSARRCQGTPCSQLQGFVHPEGPFAMGRCYPKSIGRASPSLSPLEGLPLRASASCHHEASSHGLQYDADRAVILTNANARHHDQPSPYLLCRVSKNPKVGLPLSRAAALHGIVVLVLDESRCRTPPPGVPFIL